MAAAQILADHSAAIEALVALTAPSVVAVESGRRRASGFVWKTGLVVAADEALDDGDIAVIAAGGGRQAARLVGRDPASDIALLGVAGLSAGPLAAFGAPPPRAGALAFVIGSDGEGGPLVAEGVVARSGGAWRSLRGGDIDARIELDAALRWRGEGGLAVGADGRAFGMAVFGPRRRTLVIPAATIERVAARIETHGRVGRGYLGLGLQPVAVADGEEEGARGAMIMSIDPDGPGARAGLRQGDVIVAFDGEPVRRVRALLDALGPASVGRTVSVRYLRGGEANEAAIIIGERPER